MRQLFSPEPEVHLINAFDHPYDNAVAAARSCYSSRVIGPEEVAKDEPTRAMRDRIAKSIFEAGHHTTIQHATFQFVIDKISRQCIWSFLHSHPFYNSEQVSQRYVEVKPEHFAIPPMSDDAREIYMAACRRLVEVYQELGRLVEPTVRREYSRIFPHRSPEEKRWASSIKKRCQEVARYILPVATHAHLYHTINAVTLLRYQRLCQLFDTPVEQQFVVQRMVEEVLKVDPEFAKFLEEPIAIEETPEYQWFQTFSNRNGHSETIRFEFIEEFDASLDGRISKLVDHTPNAEKTMAQAVRSVLGVPRSGLSDEDAINLVLDPAKNSYLGEALNVTTHGKFTRAMVHPYFTFRKKLSHTADSQDQRHRMTPGSRPILSGQFVAERPDYVVPVLIQATPQALALYAQAMTEVWGAMVRLLEMKVPAEFVMYLLPNAFPIRFEESGDLLNFHHKWTKRLCYTAQEEIWASCKDEVEQVAKVFPSITRFIAAPCSLRQRAGQKPYCPEGDRFCGVPVWTKTVESYQRLI